MVTNPAASGVDPRRLWQAIRNQEADEAFLDKLAVTPGVYRCTCCYDGCSYCNGTGEVVYLSGDDGLDAPLHRYLAENYAEVKPKVITQVPSR